MKNYFFKLQSLFPYIVLCGIGVWIAFQPTLVSGFSLMQTDPGDTRLNNYFLEHSFQLLVNSDYSGDVWSPTFFFPYKEVLAFSENLFGSAPIYWLFRAFFSSDIAFQLWMIAVCIANFVSFAFLMQKFNVGHGLSALGGFLFAFSMPRIVKIGHQQLLPQFFTPLVFLTALNFMKKPTSKRLALLLLLTYLQILSGIYLGWFLMFSLPIFLGIAYKLESEARHRFITYWKKSHKQAIGITLGWLALTVFTLFPYLKAKLVLGGRSYSDVDTMIPRLSSWFSVPPGSLWSSLLGWVSRDLPMQHEHHLFAGLTLIILTGLSIYTILRLKSLLTIQTYKIIKICLIVFIIIFCFSLRLPFGLSLWRIIYEVVPGSSVIRAVSRIWTIAYFYLFIAVLLNADSLLKALVNSKYLRLLIVSVICLVSVSEQIVLNLPNYEKAPWIEEVAELRDLMQTNCDFAYVSLNPARPFWADQLTAMWAGIEANVPVVNGYSGNQPPNYGTTTEPMDTARILHWLDIASKNIQGRLCMISPNVGKKNDSLIPKYAVQEITSFSNKFTSATIQFPLKKLFSHGITVLDIPSNPVYTSSSIKIVALVENKSNFIWTQEGKHKTNFSYRWIDVNGKLAEFDGDGDRTSLPWDVSPEDFFAVNAIVRTPPTPGKYQLILTMVQEDVAWFNDKNTNHPLIPMDVVPPQTY
ncbi:hypothetical protein [Coleofasciculus sp. G2-EDA-02]|uniref:hypothetical protein n=1 Tax=Coleofasciculus sp. G2-EDA-02 TaxID=3069529 RepID=UPI0032F85E47